MAASDLSLIMMAAVVGAAAALALPAPRRLPAHGRRGDPVAGSGRRPLLLALLLTAVAGSVLQGHLLVLLLIVAGALVTGRRLYLRERRDRAAARAAGRVQEYCEAVAGELSAGGPPLAVLVRSADHFPEFSTVATAAGLGSDVPAAMRRASAAPGHAELLLMAAAWQVAQRSGAGLAAALEQVGATIREQRRAARLVAAELAAAHATARMMAVLPLVLLLAGSGLGGDPVVFLTDTAPGLGCLGVGLALSLAGVAWLQRIARAVTRP